VLEPFSHIFFERFILPTYWITSFIMATPFFAKEWETLTSEELSLARAKLAGFTEAHKRGLGGEEAFLG